MADIVCKTKRQCRRPNRAGRPETRRMGAKLTGLLELTGFGQFDLDPQLNLRKYRVEAGIPG
jgi:hypothetical protein